MKHLAVSTFALALWFCLLAVMPAAASDHADHGYSSERLRLWNADGEQVLAGMQAAAIFG